MTACMATRTLKAATGGVGPSQRADGAARLGVGDVSNILNVSSGFPCTMVKMALS